MSISQLSTNPRSVRATMAVAALRSNAATTAASAAGPARQADAVQLSDTARALASATQSVNSASDVREDRIAALKSAIANGSYAVSSKDLARSMVRRSLAV